jgi:hypothetical protein
VKNIYLGILGILLLCGYYALIVLLAPNFLEDSPLTVAALCLFPIIWIVISEGFEFESAVMSGIVSLLISVGLIVLILCFRWVLRILCDAFNC